jgi:hypothetical protein
MAGVDFNVLRDEIKMEQVLEQLHFEYVGRSGEQLRGPCPVHGSSNLSSRTFSVNLETHAVLLSQMQEQGKSVGVLGRCPWTLDL